VKTAESGSEQPTESQHIRNHHLAGISVSVVEIRELYPSLVE